MAISQACKEALQRGEQCLSFCKEQAAQAMLDELGNIEEDPVPHHLFSLCTEAIAFLRALLANGTDDVILDHYNNIVQELQPVLTRSRSLKTNKPTVYSKSWFDKDCSNAQSELIIAYQASRGCPSFATVVNLLARLT
ncbi:uncharacterized protein LOC128351131 isoform X2 [Hemicordylus capensis]|uniref:uncharacterized protein LOC128351131 isoform X2 n=1 Tax=Hemicordylus capensis TaxID=884348 RepID=UPI0023032D71|nr:uncharacterized protein LOC128351131 isoform X2 [Hemicordylus capensis]